MSRGTMPELAVGPKLSTRGTTLWGLALGALVAIAVWHRASLGFNGAYLDESDYLYVSRLIEAGVPWKTYTYMFSSHIPLHVLGFGETHGGLIGARAVAAVLGLASLGFAFCAARALLGSSRVAAWSTLVLLVQAPHLFISKFATYDIVAFTFFTLSLWLLLTALRSKRYGWLLCLLASAAFAAAVLSKYVIIAMAPGMALLVAIRRPKLLLFALAPCVALVGEYVHRHWPDLKQLYQHQIKGAHAGNSTRLQIATIAGFYLGPLLVFFAGGLAWLVARSGVTWRALRVHVLGLVLALPLIALHLRSRDMVSMYKHMVLPALALAPLAGWLLHRLSRYSLAAPLAICAALTGLGVWQARRMEHGFVDLRPLLAELGPRMGPTTTVISEEGYALRYAFAGATTGRGLYEMTWFDNNGDGDHTSQDVIDAIWDGKPDYVVVYGQVMPELAHKLREGVLTHQYRKVFDQPYKLSDVMTRIRTGRVELWKRNGTYKGQYPLQ